jgi:predicted ArsR family transcriptional regulator
LQGVDLGAPRDDVLAQPTRFRLFALLGELRRPAGTEELAARLDLHPNGVRVHLERLLEAGLVVRRRERRAPGRPRDEWSLSPDAAPGGVPPRAYGDLARWLSRAIPPRPGRLREIERAGRAIGREIAPAGVDSTEAGLRDTLTALGFQPLVEEDASGRLCCRLRNCPYRDSVRENQDVICTLHRGITRGLLDVLDPEARLARFVPHDPNTAGCEIEIDGLAPHAKTTAR